MSRRPEAAAKYQGPVKDTQSPGLVLPAQYKPRVAGYAHGPFITPELVTPTEWKWRNARSYIVRSSNGHDYRCLRVSSGNEFVGYWAVELLGIPLPLPEWD